MRASYNELKSLYKQVYQGAGLAPGLYEAAANNVVWTEAIGQHGFDLFAQQLSREMAFYDCQVQLLAAEGGLFKADLGYACLAYSSHIIAGLAQARALELGYCVCLLSTSSPKAFLFSEVAKLRTLGLSGFVAWNVGENAQVASSCDQGFGLELTSRPKVSSLDKDVLLIFAQNPTLLEKLAEPYGLSFDSSLSVLSSATELEATFLRNLQTGIEISTQLWQQLTHLASRSLVESNEKSRLGAGAQ